MKSQNATVYETAFEKYAVIRPVGSGGSGMVFQVRASDDKTYAVKLLDKTRTTSQKVKRFQNEIRFCMRSLSPNIVQVVDYGQSPDGSLFYVMPYFPKTFRDLMRDRLPHRERMAVYGQVLDGVEAAHLYEVCHRDIKPENLLYDAVGKRVVLADFGIARFVEDELLTVVDTSPRERLANFAYAAPEQKTPGADVDHRADIYALGLMLNELFTDQIPQGTRPRLIAGVAPDFAYLDGLVETMMRQRPSERPGSVAAVKDELIARGNEFIQRQKVDTLKNEVVPESAIEDPLISDPIRAVEKQDYTNNALTLRLNRPVTKKWEECFRRRATAFSANVSSAVMLFNRDRVVIHVNDHFIPQAVEYFKQYCAAANEEYAATIRRENAARIERDRAALKARIMQEEAKARALAKVVL
jgi:serine/threonine protein kinase